MCCESCPKYEDCAVDSQLKEECCPKCPDYNVCFGEEKKENEAWEE